MAILDYEYDAKAVSSEVKRGIDFLYEAADRKAASGKLHKGELSPVGTEALRDYLVGSWNNTNSRVHDLKKVTVLGQSPLRLKIEGQTTYQRADGKEQFGTWSAEQSYAEEAGVLKISDYKIDFTMKY